MAGITLAQAEAALAYWMDADARLANNESFTIKDRSLTRAETLEKIKYWNKQVQRLSRGGIRIGGITPTR